MSLNPQYSNPLAAQGEQSSKSSVVKDKENVKPFTFSTAFAAPEQTAQADGFTLGIVKPKPVVEQVIEAPDLSDLSFEREAATQEPIQLEVPEPEPEPEPMISVDEHRTMVSDAVKRAFEEGRKRGVSDAQASQSMSLITSLGSVLETVDAIQERQSEAFRVLSDDASEALIAMFAALAPTLRRQAVKDHLGQMMDAVFANAQPSLKVDLIAHSSDASLISNALSALPNADRSRVTLDLEGGAPGQIELRWPNSKMTFDWQQIQDELTAKLKEAVRNLQEEYRMGDPLKKMKQRGLNSPIGDAERTAAAQGKDADHG